MILDTVLWVICGAGCNFLFFSLAFLSGYLMGLWECGAAVFCGLQGASCLVLYYIWDGEYRRVYDANKRE